MFNHCVSTSTTTYNTNNMKFVIVLFAMVAITVASANAQWLPRAQQPSSNEGRYARAAPLADLDADSSRVQRQAGGDHHDVADFGAHTGHHGAFGWYADFPVHAQGH